MFLQLYEAGLVYQSEAVVNWDPVDLTVLADEQVDPQGRSWRSGAVVERRPLRQWFFRTTSFAAQLAAGLRDPALSSWRYVLQAQQNWIGDCCGTTVEFRVKEAGRVTDRVVAVWTERPEHLHAAQFILLHPDHLLGQLGAGTSLAAVCPLTAREIPVTVAREEVAGLGRHHQTVLGLPSVDPAHSDLVSSLGLAVAGDVTAASALPSDRAEVMRRLRERGAGGHETSANLKDWLISRQRYWGTPIPMVHCAQCGPVPVPADQLPVTLPRQEEVAGQGAGAGGSPLSGCEEWRSTSCPRCGGAATRETDTMDTFVDSSWYFLRYLDSCNDQEPFSADAATNMPVDLYIGGMEHAYLHLYFARFINYFLHSIGKVPCKEPFRNLITQGMVKGRSYRLKSSTKYLKPYDVYEEEGKYFQTGTGAPVVTTWEKMSKSKYNGVDPQQMFDQFGCDTVRLMMLCNVGPSSDRNWDVDTYPGIRNMQIKLFKLVHQAVELQQRTLPELRYDEELGDYRDKLRSERNRHLRHVNYNYNVTRNLAVVIARVNSLINAAWAVPGQVKRDAPEFQQLLGEILIILAPIAPHMVSELWASFCTVDRKLCSEFDWGKGVFHQSWPVMDPNYNMTLYVKCNERKAGMIQVAKWYFDSLTLDQAFDLCCHEEKIQDKWLQYEVVDKKLDKVDDFEATLELTFHIPESTSKHQNTPEEFERLKKEKKEAAKLEKERKRAEKAERKRVYEENIARKEKISKTFHNKKQQSE